MDKQDEMKLLNTLKSIDGTLKRIEQSFLTKKQKDKFVPAIGDDKGNVCVLEGELTANS